MTHRMLPSTKNLIERLKTLDSGNSIFHYAVAYGKGSGVKSDACFARLHNFILENSLKTMHYLIREPSPSVDYPLLLKDLENYFGKVYNLALFNPLVNNTLIVQCNSREKLPLETDEVLYWILFCILRGCDREYTSYLNELKLKPLEINTARDLIIQWCVATGGQTGHTISEPIAYAYQRNKKSELFLTFVDSWLNKLKTFCGKESKFTLTQINNIIGEVRSKEVPNRYSYTYGLSQSPAYRVVEECLARMEEKNA